MTPKTYEEEMAPESSVSQQPMVRDAPVWSIQKSTICIRGKDRYKVHKKLSPGRFTRRWPLAIVLLAVAVFGWGLHYKLSLYTPSHSVQITAPAAKLLSQRERAVNSQFPSSRAPENPRVIQALILCVTLSAFFASIALFLRQNIETNKDISSFLFKSIAFIRPPPTLGYFFREITPFLI